MSINVKVGEAKTRLSELLVKVEQGEDVVISRGDTPVARLSRIAKCRDIDLTIRQIKAARAHRPKTTADEIRAWRDEGQRDQ